ncbi:MAG TPA: ATP-dependent helicase HrpB [Novosphingobium sp.]|nr:ATP-dependent helicase HrpB [Novosphingobium sp.]
MPDLPIHAVLPDLLAALRAGSGAVLIAPPGAGKTTAVAPALIGEPWCIGTVILLSPRRVAARAAAERMAELLGEKPGDTVGYLTRLDSKRSARTRVLVMTEAIFVSTIVADPELSGVGAVLFDEAHERHLDSDLGLALAIECREVLRPDLRLVVMSATIDGARFGDILGNAPVVESEGKAHPLTLRWLGASPEKRIEDAMTSAILTAWREEQGDMLAFLPGVGEIERTRERLAERLPDALILPLHGQCEPAAQRAALRRDPAKGGVGGRRRIVLATAIAETSLTLDGVSVVVDAGLSRRAEFDKAAGVTRLVTHRASQASAAQRAGRAARQGPGVAYRLWEEAAHPGRPAFDPPEMLTSDLAPLLLTLAKWGVRDPGAMAWLDPPPKASLDAARARLEALGALDGEGAITPLGQRIAALPMDPAQAAMVLFGAEAGQARDAARLALLLQERGLGGRSDDLIHRLDRWNADRSPRADASRKLAERWARSAERLVARAAASAFDPGVFLARAMPDMVAKRRDAVGENWLSAGGRGYLLDPASPLARAEWLAIGDAQGQAKGARITAAAALTAQDVETHLAGLVESGTTIGWNAVEGRAEARLQRRMGAIVLASGPDPRPDTAAMAAFLLKRALDRLDDLLPGTLVARARHAGIEALSPDSLRAEARTWLAPLLDRRRDLELPKGKVAESLLALLDWDSRKRLDALAPREFVSPAGTHHPIDYDDEGGPSVEVRVQALFGLDRHPTIGQPALPLLLKLTSPAGRPIQSTRDLPGFWRGSWRDVVRDMKGRYPRHRWPDEPWAEDPSLKTRNAFEASKRS